MRLKTTLPVLLFALLLLNLAHAAPPSRVSAEQRKNPANAAQPDERKKKKVDKTGKKLKVATPQKTQNGHPHAMKLAKKTSSNTLKNKVTPSKNTVTPAKKSHKKGAERHDEKSRSTVRLVTQEKQQKLDATQKQRYQHAKQTAMFKLMDQMGKPYHWGGASPYTGFDCSGLIYYAYKDVVKIKMPRTAKEMFHLRDAAPIKRNELEKGDLVFFRINNRSTTDHVGVYLGDGKFIQSTRTGGEIRISQLDNDYWQNHYVGARRMVTLKTIR